MDEMSVEKWWNEICGKGKREKPRVKTTQTPFRPPRNPHGGTETRTRDPSGGRLAPKIIVLLCINGLSIYKFQNVPCTLGFEVKHSKIFCTIFKDMYNNFKCGFHDK